VARERALRPDEGDAAGLIPVAGGAATAELDRLVHDRMRLGILSALAVNESLSFTDLRRLLRATDGNLSVHARKLEEAEYIACTKSFDGRVPKTAYTLAPAGRASTRPTSATPRKVPRLIKS